MDAALAGQLKLVAGVLGPLAAVAGGLAAGLGLMVLLDNGFGSLSGSMAGSSEA